MLGFAEHIFRYKRTELILDNYPVQRYVSLSKLVPAFLGSALGKFRSTARLILAYTTSRQPANRSTSPKTLRQGIGNLRKPHRLIEEVIDSMFAGVGIVD